MEQDKDLKNVFEEFMQSAPSLISINEVEEKVFKTNAKKQFNKKMKIITFASTIALSITVSFAVMQTSNSKKNKIAINSFKKEFNAAKNDANSIVENKFFNQLDKNIESNRAKIKPKTEKILLNKEDTFDVKFNESKNKKTIIKDSICIVSITSIKKDSAPLNTQNNLIKLSSFELLNLGLVQSKEGIFYEETFNKKKPYKYQVTLKNNGLSTLRSGGSLDILKNEDKYPIMFTNIEITEMGCILGRKELKDTLEIIENYNQYFPIVLNLNWGTYSKHYEVFWFPKSEYIKSLLPQWAKDSLAKNANAFSVKPALLKTIFELKKRQYVPNNLVNANVNYCKNERYILINDELAFKLGFYKQKEGNWAINLDYKRFELKKYQEGICYNTISSCPPKQRHPKYFEKYQYPIPLFCSDTAYNPNNDDNKILEIFASATEKTDELTKLINQKHALIPIKLTIGNNSVEYFWYSPTPKFMNLLSEEQKQKALQILTDSNQYKTQYIAKIEPKKNEETTIDEIFNFNKNNAKVLNTLELEDSVLANMGYTNVNGNLSIKAKVKYNEYIDFTLHKHGTTIEQYKNVDSVFVNKLIMPEYISDDLGKRVFMSFSDNKLENGTFDMNTLIPVIYKTNRSYTLVDKINSAARPNYILWFKPNSVFLSALTKADSIQIASELDSINKVFVPCKYTDYCKEKKKNIVNFEAYPIPAIKEINLKIDLINTIPFEIIFTDLSGKIVKTKSVISTEKNTNIILNIQDLESGIYYVYIQTALGDLLIKKILIAH